MRECEEKLRSVHFVGTHDWISRVTRDWISRVTHGWQVAKKGTHVKHAEELKSYANCCTTGQKSQAGQPVSSRLELATQSSRQTTMFGKNWHFAFQTHTSINTSYTHVLSRVSRENFERETLEKNKIDSSTIFILWFSKFLYFHHLHWYILERYISQNLFSPYPYLWGGYLVLGKQLGGDQLILVDAMEYSGIR